MRAVNSIRACGLKHMQFRSSLEDIEADFTDVLYQVRWLSMGKILCRVRNLKAEIVMFFNMKDISCDFWKWRVKNGFVILHLLWT